MRFGAPLDHGAGNAAQTELDGQREADRTASNDDYAALAGHLSTAGHRQVQQTKALAVPVPASDR